MVGGEQAGLWYLRIILHCDKCWSMASTGMMVVVPKRFVEERLGVDLPNRDWALKMLVSLTMVINMAKLARWLQSIANGYWAPEDIVRKLGDYTALTDCRVIARASVSRAKMSVVVKQEFAKDLCAKLGKIGFLNIALLFWNTRFWKIRARSRAVRCISSNAAVQTCNITVSILPSLLDKFRIINLGMNEFVLFKRQNSIRN